MAEIVSLTAGIISLAALFNTCIECFDCYRLARDCPAQVKTKLVRLDFEKERLLIWAEQAGLMRTDAAFRNPNIEANEGNLRDTLEQIRMLLADSTKLQDKYGIRQQEGLATLTERKVEPISRNSFEIFRASYRRFCGRFIVSQTGLKLTARVRWAILDENKFEGLIKTLRDFVDNLYWYVKVERRVQDRMVEQDIMAVTDTVDLLMIKEASEDDYQIWSDIASRAVDRAERSTITHTETDEQSASEEDEVAPGSPTRPTRSGAVGAIFESTQWWRSTPPGCFVLTNACISFSEPAPCKVFDDNIESIFSSIKGFTAPGGQRAVDYIISHSPQRWEIHRSRSLGKKLNTQFRIGNWTRNDLQQVYLDKTLSADGPKLATAFIYVAPCERLLLLAYHIFHDLMSQEIFDISIRLDDRLDVSCCNPGVVYDRMISLRRIVNMERRTWTPNVDEIWLEQRIRTLEKEEPRLHRNADPANKIKHIFNEENYSPLETVGAIVLLGEAAHVREIMDSESFPRDSHVPRPREVYAMHRKPQHQTFTRHYLGTYNQNQSFVETSTTPSDQSQPQPALPQHLHPSEKPPVKRKRISVDDEMSPGLDMTAT